MKNRAIRSMKQIPEEMYMAEIPYTVIRTDRKSIALQIDSEGTLTVRAPRRAKDSVIKALVMEKESWITKKQRQAAAYHQRYRPAEIRDGGSLYYLGQPYMIHLETAGVVYISGNAIHIPHVFSEQDVTAFLKEQARKVLQARIETCVGIMGLGVPKWRLSGAKTRWGSCSCQNSLNLAWRLIFCPVDVIDYVVVHELCHIAVKNHSASFWQRVEAVMPGYKTQRAWLKTNRGVMNVL